MKRLENLCNDGETGFCKACGQACVAALVDFGIGAYEYWGARGTHRDLRPVSPCCEASVVPEHELNEEE